MKERLALLTLNDLKQLGISLEIEYSMERKGVFIEKIYNALSKKTYSEQYEILKQIFTQGKFDVIYFKRESIPTSNSGLIIPNNKETLFSECIIMADKEYVICAKKHLQNQSLTPTQARKLLGKYNLKGRLIFGEKIVFSTFLALIKDKKFRILWENMGKKYAAFYCSYTSESEILTIHSKLSSNNEQIKKQIKNISQEETSIDDLNINVKLQEMEKNEQILIKHFVADYPKELSNKVKNVGVNILELINNDAIRYKIIFKTNYVFTIENIDTTLDDIKNILRILIGLDNELKKKNL